MNNKDIKIKNNLGFKGESHLIDILKKRCFILYKRNIKKNNSEIDVIMYKLNYVNKTMDIRVIEVKTRSNYEFNLLNFNIIKKWSLIKPHIFSIKQEVSCIFGDVFYSEIHFDFVLIKSTGQDLSIYAYFKDVNLLI